LQDAKKSGASMNDMATGGTVRLIVATVDDENDDE
jgi:hypothetical protein